jgi:hypothetical protein
MGGGVFVFPVLCVDPCDFPLPARSPFVIPCCISQLGSVVPLTVLFFAEIALAFLVPLSLYVNFRSVSTRNPSGIFIGIFVELQINFGELTSQRLILGN